MYALIYDSNSTKNEFFDLKKISKMLETNNFVVQLMEKCEKKSKKIKGEKIHIINGCSLSSINYLLNLLDSDDSIILYNFKFWHSFISFIEFNKIKFNRENILEIANSTEEIEKIIKNLKVDESSKKLKVLYNDDINSFTSEKNIHLSKSTEKFMDNFFKNLKDDGNDTD